MEPRCWRLAKVNTAASEPIQNMAPYQDIHCAAEYYRIPSDTSFSPAEMRRESGSNALSCVGRTSV
ncbi:uncharacterized protein V6R79_017237 [Siganus canaliculatus]